MRSLCSAFHLLNYNLNLVLGWCSANKLNGYKVQDLSFGLTINGDNSPRFLGFLLQPNLKWNHDDDHVASKTSKRLVLFRSLRSSVSQEVLLTIYFAMHIYVHSRLAYGTALWTNSGCSVKVLVLHSFNEWGAPPWTHCEPLFSALTILSPPSLYIFLAFMHIRDSFPNIIVSIDVRYGHNTRIKTNKAVARCKCDTTKHRHLQEETKLYNARNLSESWPSG